MKYILTILLVMCLSGCSIPLKITYQNLSKDNIEIICKNYTLKNEAKALFLAICEYHNLSNISEKNFWAKICNELYLSWDKKGSFFDYVYEQADEIGKPIGKYGWAIQRDILSPVKILYEIKLKNKNRL